MKKENLKVGNVVELRNGALCLIHPTNNYIDVSDIENDIIFRNLIDGTVETMLRNIDSNLRNKLNFFGSDEYDIVKVYEDYTLKKVLWKCKEIIVSEDEKAILRNLPKEYKWIARDENGELYIFKTKPRKSGMSDLWESEYGNHKEYTIFEIYNHLFQFVTWEDEEPYLISDLLEEN